MSDYIDLNNYPELKDYIYIETLDELNKTDYGVYVKYINKNLKLRSGGFYIRNFESNNTTYLVLYQQKYNKFYQVNFNKNYIFRTKTRSEKLRELFLTFIKPEDKHDSDSE